MQNICIDDDLRTQGYINLKNSSRSTKMLQIPGNVSVVKFQHRKFFRLMTERKNHVLLDGAF